MHLNSLSDNVQLWVCYAGISILTLLRSMPHFDPECSLRTCCFYLVYTCKDVLTVKSDNSHVVEREEVLKHALTVKSDNSHVIEREQVSKQLKKILVKL